MSYVRTIPPDLHSLLNSMAVGDAKFYAAPRKRVSPLVHSYRMMYEPLHRFKVRKWNNNGVYGVFIHRYA